MQQIRRSERYRSDLSVSKKYFRHAVRILKLSKSFKILLIERAVGFLPPPHTPPAALSHQSSAGFFYSLRAGVSVETPALFLSMRRTLSAPLL